MKVKMESVNLKDFVNDYKEDGELFDTSLNIKNESPTPTGDDNTSNVATKIQREQDIPDLTNIQIKIEPTETSEMDTYALRNHTNEGEDIVIPVFTADIAGSQIDLVLLDNTKIPCKQLVEETSPYSNHNVPLVELPHALDLKIEKVEVVNDDENGEMIKLENGCTNSACNLGKRCLQTYKCSKCNVIFTEKHSFSAHFKKCAHNSNVAHTVPKTVAVMFAGPKHTQREHRGRVENLIQNVEKWPCLYDSENEDYNNIALKDFIWRDIASECNFSRGQAAKATWKKLKDDFRNILQQEHSGNNHQSKLQTILWKYRTQMEFLVPFIDNRQTDLNIQDEHPNNSGETNQTTELNPIRIPQLNDVNKDTDDEDVSLVHLPAKKPKISPTNNETYISNAKKRHREGRTKVWNQLREGKQSKSSAQSLDMFFLSMCETTKNLPPQLQFQVKRRVFQAVIEAEEVAATINNNRTNPNLPSTSSSSHEEQYLNTGVSFPLRVLTDVIDNTSSSQED